ncbi:MAG: chemotaxis protein [Candidatus Polarisedimenticolaceae bacterium]|nr:chemotaxis protein [Candidatus Polarisedimenticolaceae bacterium]
MAGILDGVDNRTQLAGQNRLELLLFRLGRRQRFGINVFKVREVIQCPPLTQMPGSNPVVRGVANMRGKTISVMDLSLAIGGPPLGGEQEQFVIVTEYNRQTQGFMVHSIEHIVNMNWEDILPPPTGITGESYLTAVTRMEQELIGIIDVEKVMKEVMGGNETVSEGIIDTNMDLSAQHVLVVDDSVVARKQVKRVLDQLGVTCTLCKNGQHALDQLQEWVVEGRDLYHWLALIISDIEMPQMDGYSLTAAIRKSADLDKLHIFLHSSLSGVFNESMVKKVGANHFLPKYEPNELAELVQARLKEHAEQCSHAA